MATTPTPKRPTERRPVNITAAYAADIAARRAKAGTPIFDQLVAEYTARGAGAALDAVRAES